MHIQNVIKSQNRHYRPTGEIKWIEAAATAGRMTSDMQLRNQKTCPLSHPSLSSYCTTSRYEGGHTDTLTQAYRMWTYFFIQCNFEGPFEKGKTLKNDLYWSEWRCVSCADFPVTKATNLLLVSSSRYLSFISASYLRCPNSFQLLNVPTDPIKALTCSA